MPSIQVFPVLVLTKPVLIFILDLEIKNVIKCASVSLSLKHRYILKTIYDLDVALRTSQESIRKIKSGQGNEEKEIQTVRNNLLTIAKIREEYKGIDDWPEKVLELVRSYGEKHLQGEAYLQIFR